ncbi:hypothetical protein B0H19DRAFT_1122441 [Mycena capillaripes]|nr:hypothetical protein B0H19DRAFT_1122441 [Mycena capillaripes]
MLAVLEADRARVADLEAQILHLERSISELRLQKSLAQERLDSYTYPVLTLPNEIVSEIFMHFLPTYPIPPPLTGIYSPTLLTHICRRWREIALGNPSLWRAMGAGGDYYHGDAVVFRREAHIFDIWMNRSLFCPVSLEFGTDAAQIDVNMLAVVVPHRARWEYLELHLPSVDLLEGSMPLLRQLHLRLNKYCYVEPRGDTVVTLHMPLLRTVIIDDIAAYRILLPWAQVTSLTLLSVYPRECVPILQQTANLVHCELRVYFDEDSDQPGQDITLKCLESLTLVDPGDDPTINFLTTFVVPALRSLRIPEAFLGPSPIDSLTTFLSKSTCKMEKVHIRVTSPRSVSHDSYRVAFPSIRKFSFPNDDLEPEGEYMFRGSGDSDFDSSSVEAT